MSAHVVRLRWVGAAHSRHSTIDEVGFPVESSILNIRTMPLERQSRACQHVRRVHLHGPEAATRLRWATLTSVRSLPRSHFDVMPSEDSREIAPAVKHVQDVVAILARRSSPQLD
jgi:hypothetical protein